MGVKEELVPRFEEIAEEARSWARDGIGRAPHVSRRALEISSLEEPFYLQAEMEETLMSISNGYNSFPVVPGPERKHETVIRDFLEIGPARAENVLRDVLRAFLEAGVSRETLITEVDVAIVATVIDS